LAEISCADLVWKMGIVTFISSSFGQSLGCLFLYEHPFINILLLPPVHYFPSGHPNVDMITAKPTSYFLIQSPLSSVMNLSFRVASRISPAVVSHLLHLRYTETYRNAESNCKSHSFLGLESLCTGSLYPIRARMEAASLYPFLVYLRPASY
jgi:hypothetical protein